MENEIFAEDTMTEESEGLARALNDGTLMKEFSCAIERIERLVDGDPVNKDPLTDIPNPEMRLYVIYENYFDTKYFDTKEELEDCCISNGFSMTHAFVLEYIRNFAGRSDVIRETNIDGKCKYYVAIDEDGDRVYNYDRSVYKGKFTWEFEYGGLRGMYSAFRDRGVVFENDVYGKIFRDEEQFLKMCKRVRLSKK